MSTLKKEIVIRVAALDDAEELLKIYAPYVRETAITFEYEVPSPEEFRERIAHTLEKIIHIWWQNMMEKIRGVCICQSI